MDELNLKNSSTEKWLQHENATSHSLTGKRRTF